MEKNESSQVLLVAWLRIWHLVVNGVASHDHWPVEPVPAADVSDSIVQQVENVPGYLQGEVLVVNLLNMINLRQCFRRIELLAVQMT